MWDTEVDVAVIGAGLGGLATAIATVDAGGEVLVADAAPGRHGDGAPVVVRTRVDTRSRCLLPDTVDPETSEYFAAISEGILEFARVDGEPAVPRSNARNLSQDEVFKRPVETFVGARLAGWAAKCITSPFGLVYTSMLDWHTTSMKSDANESIEVLSVGTMDGADGFGGSALRDWIATRAGERDIEVETSSALERIVFEEGLIIGVVLTTPSGPLAVRTRAGITFAPHDDETVYGADDPAAPDRLHVCLVGRTASRYGRVELLATEPSAPSRPICTGSRRQVREGLHDARQPSLDGWRCGKVHRYPALGQ